MTVDYATIKISFSIIKPSLQDSKMLTCFPSIFFLEKQNLITHQQTKLMNATGNVEAHVQARIN